MPVKISTRSLSLNFCPWNLPPVDSDEAYRKKEEAVEMLRRAIKSLRGSPRSHGAKRENIALGGNIVLNRPVRHRNPPHPVVPRLEYKAPFGLLQVSDSQQNGSLDLTHILAEMR